MADLPREFDPVDLENAKERCKVLPEGWDWERFVEWLNVPANEQEIINRYGADYTLRQALDSLNAPAMSNTASSRLRMQRFRDRRKVKDAFTPEQHGPPRNKMSDPNDYVVKDDAEEIKLPEIDPNQVEVKLRDLLAGQTDIQPQDVTTARRLVQAEILVESCYNYLNTCKKPSQISALSLAIEKQSKIATDCQRLLGIDRAKRQADASKRSDQDAVMEMIDAAGKFALEQAIPIIHCDTLVGWVLPEFREMPLTVSGDCPKCHQPYTIVHTPSAEDIAGATEPPFVAEEEAQYAPEENDADNLPEPPTEDQVGV